MAECAELNIFQTTVAQVEAFQTPQVRERGNVEAGNFVLRQIQMLERFEFTENQA